MCTPSGGVLPNPLSVLPRSQCSRACSRSVGCTECAMATLFRLSPFLNDPYRQSLLCLLLWTSDPSTLTRFALRHCACRTALVVIPLTVCGAGCYFRQGAVQRCPRSRTYTGFLLSPSGLTVRRTLRESPFKPVCYCLDTQKYNEYRDYVEETCEDHGLRYICCVFAVHVDLLRCMQGVRVTS